MTDISSRLENMSLEEIKAFCRETNRDLIITEFGASLIFFQKGKMALERVDVQLMRNNNKSVIVSEYL